MNGSFLALALATVLFQSPGSADDAIPIERVLIPARVCTISDTIAIDVDGDKARSITLNVVIPRDTGQGLVWRGMHFDTGSPEIAAAGGDHDMHDIADVARDNLRPLSSEYSRGGRRTAFVFDYNAGKATKLVSGDGPAETVPLNGTFIMPDGPGAAILYQAIPWADGLRLRGRQVDRWRGSGAERLKAVTITVLGSSTFAVGSRSLATWVVQTIPDDRSFSIEEHVTKERPYRVVRTIYLAGPGKKPRLSEVRAIMNGKDCN